MVHGEAHSFFQLQCVLSGEYRETAGDCVDAEAGYCGAYGNENTVTGGMQLHGTTSGWIHGDTLWMGTRLLHESIDGSLDSTGQAFPATHDQGD